MKHLQAFRIELLKRRLSMQEVFDEFALMIANEEHAAMKMIDKIVFKKNKEKMDKLLKADIHPTKRQESLMKSSKDEVISEHSQSSFYDLIERTNPLNKANREKK